MKNLISKAAFDKALGAGRQALARKHAVSARYNTRTHMLTVNFSNGFACSFDVRTAPVLGDRPDADYSNPYVTPGGDGLIFDNADLEVGLPALVAPQLPLEIARAAVAASNGRRTTPGKSAAARLNGAKGGRPKKVEHALAALTSMIPKMKSP